MSQVPKLVKLTLAVMALALVVKVLKWITGIYNVREPLDWVFIAMAALGVAAALGTAAWSLFRAGLEQKRGMPSSGEAARRPVRYGVLSGGMVTCAMMGLASIFMTFSSTDGGDPYSVSSIGWAGYTTMALGMLMLAGMAVWTSVKVGRKR
ncbi:MULTISPECIES: hypothetical protein [Streptosporangium]|uniref:Uncharacterized membrane protein YcjF (UPF0283 family) n=1 Tax=Streptosporangium brasiliense TaxID=47480 RepID=A0ABT9R5J6_9ACTN|nr:hypothetical protein [Streptosporangium brasiliense]MDP9864513.1 uncharacterized membrane protein YcjF (UPF0283 family) [Streptosporangium brasiliense]